MIPLGETLDALRWVPCGLEQGNLDRAADQLRAIAVANPWLVAGVIRKGLEHGGTGPVRPNRAIATPRPVPCEACGGRGYQTLRMQPRAGELGGLTAVNQCPACKGYGAIRGADPEPESKPEQKEEPSPDGVATAQRITAALELARRFGQTEGDHHRAWVIDQMVRVLIGPGYDEWVAEYEDGGEYSWSNGIAP